MQGENVPVGSVDLKRERLDLWIRSPPTTRVMQALDRSGTPGRKSMSGPVLGAVGGGRVSCEHATARVADPTRLTRYPSVCSWT
jgi:hypothetical protein